MSGVAAGAGKLSGLNVGAVSDGFLSDAGVVATGSGGSTGVPFAGIVGSRWWHRTSALDQKVSHAMTVSPNGSGVEIHDAMIATFLAMDMAF